MRQTFAPSRRALTRTQSVLAVAFLILGWCAAALGGAGTAAAHPTLIAPTPPQNAELNPAPAPLSAPVSEAMQPQFAAMTVVGPDGNLWSTGDPVVDGPVISVGVRPLGPSGTYTVNYRATSADGHVVSGSWSFRLTVPSTGTPGPPVEAAEPPPSDDGSIPVWPFYVGAVVVVAAGAVWAVRRRT